MTTKTPRYSAVLLPCFLLYAFSTWVLTYSLLFALQEEMYSHVTIAEDQSTKGKSTVVVD